MHHYKLHPLKLSYTTAHMLWGGSRLIDEWGKTSEIRPLAETYELSVRDDGHMSFIENGDSAGLSLKEYIEKIGNSAVSDTYDGGRFPLLIKFIDACDKLSVQVHPDDIYARDVENDSGKTEVWYIIDAEPGAKIVYGLREGITREDFADAVKNDGLDSVMNYVEVKPGESYFVPSGMLHAIGKGILIAEIQQNSDLTYRVYDYGRLGVDGKPRELHVEKALDVVRPFALSEIREIQYSGNEPVDGCFADSKYFKAYHINEKKDLVASPRSFHCLLALSDGCIIVCGGKKYAMSKGECWFIPAGLGEYSLEGSSVDVLLSSL